MSASLVIHRLPPGASLQDQGRPGWLSYGLSISGATDRDALFEGAALLDQDPNLAALEIPGGGAEFQAQGDIRIALTGAPLRASIDGQQTAWNASHLLADGARLRIGAPQCGIYGYLHVGGGFSSDPVLKSRSAHFGAGLGPLLQAGQRLPVGSDPHLGVVGLCLPLPDRFEGGDIRVVTGPQTALFSDSEIARFQSTAFQRDTRSNRMGARLAFEGEGFQSQSGLSVLSEVIQPGDIQMTGDGTPFVLLYECQTTGGYPRIGTVLPCDLARVAQAQPGATLRFRFVSLDEGLSAERSAHATRAALASRCKPLIRDPHDMMNLLDYQLISGATRGDDLERPLP